MDRAESNLAEGSRSTVSYKALLESAKSLAEAGDMTAKGLAKKLSVSLSMPEEDVEINRPIHAYGVDSLVAVEVRYWFLKELKAEVAVFDILESESIRQLSVLAARRSEYLPASSKESAASRGRHLTAPPSAAYLNPQAPWKPHPSSLRTSVDMTFANNIHVENGYQKDAYTYYPILIVGAGVSGLAMGCRLKEKLGFDQFRIFDRQSGIGGTWWVNRYPGVACDVPSALYSYSFAPFYTSESLYPTGEDFVRYLHRVAASYKIVDKVQLNTDVTELRYREANGDWEVTLSHLVPGAGDLSSADRNSLAINKGRQSVCIKQEIVRAKVVVSCVGFLVQPNAWPSDIPGRDIFHGEIFHSARWRDDIDFKGKDVVVVGTGCSAAQIVPSLLEKPLEARSVTQLMRTPPWVMPRLEEPFGKDSLIPEEYKEMMTPRYGYGCKRRVFDSAWLQSMNRSNFRLITGHLQRLEPDGVILSGDWSDTGKDSTSTAKEEHVHADIIVLANGFEATRWLHPLTVYGRGGKSIHSVWDERGGPQAYMGTAVDGFPNFFIATGPNTLNGHSSVILESENITEYILKIVKPVLRGDALFVEAKKEAEIRWTMDIQRELKKTVFPGCASWYHDENGWNSTMYPRSQTDFTSSDTPRRNPPRSPQKRIQDASKQDPKRMTTYGNEVDADNEPTPRPLRYQRSAPSRASGQSEDSNEDARTTSSTQPTSAIKSFADLQFALRPTVYQNLDGSSAARLGGFLKKFGALKQLSSGIAVIPDSVRPRLQTALHPDDYPPGFAYKASRGSQHTQYETRICDEVFRIHTQAHDCDKTRQAEPTWNAQVYGPLLQLAIANPKYNGALGFQDITTARIQPVTLVAKHTTGAKMQSKMADFCVFLNPSPPLHTMIHKHLSLYTAAAQSVNQTMVASIRQKPIAINWESKRPYTGGETSDVQLSIWLGAQLARIREMLDLVTDKGDKDKGKTNKGKINRDKNVLLPALSAHGNDVDLLVFEEQESQNVLYGRLRLGSFSTVYGIYQILGGLEVLIDWAHTDYRSWFAEKVNRTS
ncbi:MAG: hypothetical protein Q9190_000362 [Brigantiaea leucoxantha]